MSGKHVPIADAVRDGLVTAATLAEIEARFPRAEVLMTPPEMTAGGWWRVWARRRLDRGGWTRINAPWVSHDPERAARALLGERPEEYGL